MSDASRKDPLEPPSVATKPILMVTAGSLVFLVLMLVLLEGFYLWRVKATPNPTERSFPAPVLETSTSTRAVRMEMTGPKIPEPTRQLDPKVAPAPLTSGPIPLDRAMAIIASRGVHAYDPVAPAPTPAPRGGG
jgi:hypothetical protein